MFLRNTGLAVVAAGVLVACSDDEDPSETGQPPTTTTGGSAGPTAGDVDLATAAIQIENTAVAAYTAVADLRGDDLQAAGAADTALLFRDHHREHAGALNGLLSDNGVDTIPEDQLFAGITLPDADAIGSLPILDIAAFARGLENQAAEVEHCWQTLHHHRDLRRPRRPTPAASGSSAFLAATAGPRPRAGGEVVRVLHHVVAEALRRQRAVRQHGVERRWCGSPHRSAGGGPGHAR